MKFNIIPAAKIMDIHNRSNGANARRAKRIEKLLPVIEAARKVYALQLVPLTMDQAIEIAVERFEDEGGFRVWGSDLEIIKKELAK